MMVSNSKNIILLSAILLITLSQINNHMGSLCLPAISSELLISPQLAKLSSAFSIIGFGLSQLMFGYLSDHLGRKKPTIIGLLIFIISSVLVVFSFAPKFLLLGRFMQGVGIGCTGAVASAMIRDEFSGNDLNKAFSYVSMAITLTPFISFMLGGHLQQFLGWRTNFIFMTLYGTMILTLFLTKIPETNTSRTSKISNFKEVIFQYTIIVKNIKFKYNLIMMILLYAGEFCYLIQCPMLFQKTMHISPANNGNLMLVTACGMFIGATISSRLVKKESMFTIFILGIGIIWLASAGMFLLTLAHIFSLYTIVFSMAFYMIGSGIIFPNLIAGCMEQFPNQAGMAGSLMSGLLMLGTSFLSFAIVCISANSWMLLPIFLLLSSSLLFLIFIVNAKILNSNLMASD